MPKHGGRGLRLADNADGHIGLGEPGQRLLDVAGGLILGDYGLETVDSSRVVALIHVVTANVHFAASELIAGAFQLGLGADGVFGSRILPDHLFQRGYRLLGPALVAGNVRDLVVMRGRNQVLGIRRIRTSRVQGHVPGRRANAAVVIAGVVEGVSRHQQRLASPVGIGMLTVDFLKFLRCRLRILGVVHEVQALIVELVGGLLDKGVVLRHELVPERASAASAQGDRQQTQTAGQTQLPAEPGVGRCLALFERHTLCRHG